MTTVIQNKFDGGEARDIRNFSTDQNELSRNFDVFSEPHNLNQLPDSVEETYSGTGGMAGIEMCNVVKASIAGNTYYIGAGYTSDTNKSLAFYYKTNIYDSGWVQQSVGTANSFLKNSLISYRGSAFAVDTDLTACRLIRYDGSGVITVIGTITDYNSIVSVFVHPQDNLLYVVIGKTIATWDGTTFSQSSTILPTGFTAVSITDYGSYLAIAGNPQYTSQPVCYLWGRDLTLNTLQGVISLGSGQVSLVENIDNNLFFVMTEYYGYGGNYENKIIIKAYSGGSAQVVTETFSSLTSLELNPYHFKAKSGNKLYFTIQNSYSVYVFGKNSEGQYILNQERFIRNGLTTSGYTDVNAIGGMSMLGNVLFIGFWGLSDGFHLFRTSTTGSTSISYVNTSIYKTTINPNMPIIDRYKDKQLEGVRISYTGKASGTIALKYSVDGSTFTTIISESTTAIEDTKEATTESDGTPFLSGKEFQFQIESDYNIKIHEIAYKYKVLPTAI